MAMIFFCPGGSSLTKYSSHNNTFGGNPASGKNQLTLNRIPNIFTAITVVTAP